MRCLTRIATIAAILTVMPAMAQSLNTEHTLKLDNPDSRPPATLADINWLVGAWSGPGLGGNAEEVWSPPSAGTMVGSFKLTKDDAVLFYEFMLLVEEQGTLSLKLKHFNADLSGWEEKEDYVNFSFVKADAESIHFSGLSFYRISPNELHVYVALRDGENIREEKLIYLRKE